MCIDKSHEMKQPARLTLTLRREDEPLPLSIFSYYRRGKLISLALNLNPAPAGIRKF